MFLLPKHERGNRIYYLAWHHIGAQCVTSCGVGGVGEQWKWVWQFIFFNNRAVVRQTQIDVVALFGWTVGGRICRLVPLLSSHDRFFVHLLPCCCVCRAVRLRCLACCRNCLNCSRVVRLNIELCEIVIITIVRCGHSVATVYRFWTW